MDPVTGPARFAQRIGVRLAVLLTIALLPIGVLSVLQTRQSAEIEQARAELTLLALTEQSVTADRVLTQRALGSARALATVVPTIAGDPEACRRRMAAFVEEGSIYSFAGFIPSSGVMTCSSSGREFDFSGWDDHELMLSNPEPMVIVNEEAPLSRTSVIVISYPSFDAAGTLLGYVSLSVPTVNVRPDIPVVAGMDIVIFTRSGAVVGAGGFEGGISVEDRLPASMVLSELVRDRPGVFTARDGLGERRAFAIVPFAEDRLFALASFPDRSAGILAGGYLLPSWLLPGLMWAASVLVSYFAIDWLVIRHLRGLNRRMREFADSRLLPKEGAVAGLPLEIAEMEDDFTTMTRQIVRDEAEVENALHQQRVLLKEVHHRVKNNLQLISSIINMQMRELSSPEARLVLRRVQDRVLGLAAIHRNLYQTTDVRRLEAGEVISEIVDHMADIGSEGEESPLIEKRIDPVDLYPDQAVPLCMFVTEAMTNALKYLGAPAGGGHPVISVSLETSGDGAVDLVIANTLGEGGVTPVEGRSRSSGLGRRLLAAFAAQLDARLEDGERDGRYGVRLSFRERAFVDEGDRLDAEEQASARAATFAAQ
ncbi:two-component sensor histidine kinase [Hasllibacter halocynthiae]|uniref:histidine kinase n=1 Tax=Hasllibacter halocynthiae TaxID=595589 RepID=A0A2T0X1T5_9RHOB|nr:sensor histidine kinase [Hasllibacter halocynthiae]PRY92901.1 two-component sensor histidine kinase [Hasllibacter halocynthiae]